MVKEMRARQAIVLLSIFDGQVIKVCSNLIFFNAVCVCVGVCVVLCVSLSAGTLTPQGLCGSQKTTFRSCLSPSVGFRDWAHLLACLTSALAL